MSRSCFAPSRGSSQGSPVDGCPYLVISVHHPSISAVCGHTTSHHHGGSWGHSCSWELGQGWHVHGATRIGCLGAGCPQGGLLILLVAPGPSRPVPWGLASMRAEAEAVKAGRSIKDGTRQGQCHLCYLLWVEAKNQVCPDSEGRDTDSSSDGRHGHPWVPFHPVCLLVLRVTLPSRCKMTSLSPSHLHSGVISQSRILLPTPGPQVWLLLTQDLGPKKICYPRSIHLTNSGETAVGAPGPKREEWETHGRPSSPNSAPRWGQVPVPTILGPEVRRRAGAFWKQRVTDT